MPDMYLQEPQICLQCGAHRCRHYDRPLLHGRTDPDEAEREISDELRSFRREALLASLNTKIAGNY